MKRLVVGGLLAAIAWMIGTQFDLWYAKWLGLFFGFISGLVLEDWEVTKRVAKEKWSKTIAWRPNWKLFGQYVLNNVLSLTLLSMWIAASVLIEETGIEFLFNEETGVGLLSFIYSSALVFCTIFVVSTSIVPVFDDYEETVKISKDISYFSIKYLNPISLIILPVWGFVVHVIPFIFQLLSEIPRLTVSACRMIKKFCLFITYTLISLIAREKTLAFAICVTTGAGVGMYMGKTIIYGAVAAITASTMIFVSDKLRGFAQSRLELLKA